MLLFNNFCLTNELLFTLFYFKIKNFTKAYLIIITGTIEQQRMEAIVKYLDVSQWKKREKVRKTTPSDSSMDESESISNQTTSKTTKHRETRMNDRIRKALQTKGAGGVTNNESDNDSSDSGDSSQSRSSILLSCSEATKQHQRNKGRNKQQQLRNSDNSVTVTKGTNKTDKETNDKTAKKKERKQQTERR